MRRYSHPQIWFIAFLLLIFFSPGCCNPGANPDLAAPIVTSEMPLSASAGLCTTVVTATFSLPMNPTSINGSTFTLAGPGTTAVTGTVSYDASSSTATFTPSSALLATTAYTATITTGATDEYGIALASNFVWTFTTGSCVPPTVISVTPPTVSVGVCPSTAVTATFSQAMNPSTINTTTFTLTAGTPPVAVTGVVTYAGSTATFTPSSPLALNTHYTATITTGAMDLSGVSLASNFVWTFTTATVACIPPVVVSVAPPNLAVGICPNTLLVATFSEAMNPATINTTTFTLTLPGTPPVAVTGVVTYNPAIYAATFTPTDPLALDTLYTATITTGAQDLGGDSLASDYVWTFTTSSNVHVTPPSRWEPPAVSDSGGSTVSSTVNEGTDVIGDIGVWPGYFDRWISAGNIYGDGIRGDAVAQTAQGDLTTAYNYAAAAAGGAVLTCRYRRGDTRCWRL